MALQEPELKGTLPDRGGATNRETFRRRLSYYITGLLIGTVLVALMVWARWRMQQAQGSAAPERTQQAPQP